MLSASVFETFTEDGYIVTPVVFSSSEILAVRKECERVRARTGTWVVLGAARENARLFEFVRHGVFRRICSMTIGADIDLLFDGVLHKPSRGGKELRWHQDSGYGRTDPSFVSCWLPLSTGAAAAGGLWVAPGSHALGPIKHTRSPATSKEYAGPVCETIPWASRALDLTLGQVVVMHSELLHRTGPNETDLERLAYQCGFSAASTQYLDGGLPAYHKLPVFRSPTESERPDTSLQRGWQRSRDIARGRSSTSWASTGAV